MASEIWRPYNVKDRRKIAGRAMQWSICADLPQKKIFLKLSTAVIPGTGSVPWHKLRSMTKDEEGGGNLGKG